MTDCPYCAPDEPCALHTDKPSKGFVTIRLEDSLRAQMQKLADDSERSLSAEIRLAIREYLKNGEKP